MKRDITLIALLLTYLEEFGNCHPIGPPQSAGYSATKIHYHIGLCWEAGFIEAVQVSGDETPKRYKMMKNWNETLSSSSSTTPPSGSPRNQWA